MLNAPRSERLHGLGDFLTVIVRAVEVGADAAQGFAEVGGAGFGQHRFEVIAADFQQQARLAGVDQQLRLAQQAFFVEARRTGQRRQARQQAQIVFAEHLFQALGGHGCEAATSEFGEAIEIQQLALWKQHHQRAHGVVQQHGLHLARGIEAVVVEHFFVGNAQLVEQQPNNRRSLRRFGDESSFGHGLYPFLKQWQEYNQLCRNDPAQTATVLTLGRIAAHGAANGQAMG